MDTKEFVRENNITMDYDYVDSNPNFILVDDEWNRHDSHYKVTLHYGKRQMTTYYSMGSAHTRGPEAEDVLDCLAMDAAGIENARSFEDWCGDYGYDTDSRRAEKTFKACQKAAEKLEKFMGDKYQELLWETERL